jgi:hypothetical protein
MHGNERRKYPRAAVDTCVTLSLGAAELGVYDVVDVSGGGALLQGRCPVPVGESLTVRLHFSPFEVVAGAVAVRVGQRQGVAVFAVTFALMEPEVRACVQSLVELSRPWWSDEPGTDRFVMEKAWLS